MIQIMLKWRWYILSVITFIIPFFLQATYIFAASSTGKYRSSTPVDFVAAISGIAILFMVRQAASERDDGLDVDTKFNYCMLLAGLGMFQLARAVLFP